MDSRSLRNAVGVAIGLLATAGLGFGLRADAGGDVSRFWGGVTGNPVVSFLYLIAMGIVVILWLPSIRRAIGIRTDQDLRSQIKHWLDEEMEYSVRTMAERPADRAFHLDAELVKVLPDNTRQTLFGLTVFKHKNELAIRVGLEQKFEDKDLELWDSFGPEIQRRYILDARNNLGLSGTSHSRLGTPLESVRLDDVLWFEH